MNTQKFKENVVERIRLFLAMEEKKIELDDLYEETDRKYIKVDKIISS